MKTFYCLIFFGLVACNAPDTQTQQEETTEPKYSSEQSEEVLNHHLEAFLANDLEALMADYDDASVLVTPDSVFTGFTSIQAFFEGLLPSFPTEGTTIELDKMVIKDELAYIIWHGTTPFLKVPFGTDTFIIKKRKIKRQTFAGIIEPIAVEE